MVSLARRGFFQGRLSTAAGSIRPPWALPETEFIDACTRCDDCLAACPTQIITTGIGGFPAIDFHQGECTFCSACVQACGPEALRVSESRSAWTLAPVIADSCLASNNIECRVCAEACDHTAIRFFPRAGGIALPVINASLCNGCGACVAPCPGAAITLKEGSCK